MKLRIVTASAGTGKTTHLAKLLDEEVGKNSVRPEAILATTFTKQASAELLNRVRTRLLGSGKSAEAQALLTARIGTVNAVCGSLVTDFSFELGLSPELRVLDEAGAELALKRALASVVSEELSGKLQEFKDRFDREFDWHFEVRRLIEAARANDLDETRFVESAKRSLASLDACLGEVASDGAVLDRQLMEAIDVATAAIAAGSDSKAGTKKYSKLLTDLRRDLGHGRLRWGNWAKLAKEVPNKASLEHAVAVQDAAAQHIRHPGLRAELHELIGLMFAVAGDGLRAYQEHKRDNGLIDFVDQEVLALKLLKREDVCAVLKHELDLVLVDEFQDTSPLQLAIFLRLAELAKQSVWVGDPKQAIYGFRGTDPKLMDAAIESLTSTTQDAGLVADALNAVRALASVETLSTSYRSRPSLVELTNAVFAQAFAKQQGMEEERTTIAAHRPELDELGPAASQWPLKFSGQYSLAKAAAAVAAGTRDMLLAPPEIWDRATEVTRPATPGDVAILCRTNAQCLEVSEALGRLDVASVVARMKLKNTAEAQLLLAGLRLFVDPSDRRASAVLVRVLEHPEDPAAFMEEALAADDAPGLDDNEQVKSLLAARELAPDLDLLATVDAVVDAVNLRELCAAWGETEQRIANLDAMRSHACRYTHESSSQAVVPSTVGFLSYFEELAADKFMGEKRQDKIARVGSTNAVNISTWHAAKGLEWPIVVLFGLESLRDARAYGVHVLSERTQFDLADPLGGRWLHFWPNPYTNAQQGGVVKDAYARSDAYQHVSTQADREALRVLYVGWTRARDQLILAAHSGKLLLGLLGTVESIQPGLLTDLSTADAGAVATTWAGHGFDLHVAPQVAADPVAGKRVAGAVRRGRPSTDRVPAAIAPSSAAPQKATLQPPVSLGPPTMRTGKFDSESLGTAVHAFFGADDSARDYGQRLAIAEGLLQRYGVATALESIVLVELADRLWRWIAEQFGADATVRTEWPVGETLASGTAVLGTADMIVETPGGVAVIDHKSFGLESARKKVDQLAGQLGCYADAIARARGCARPSTWVHMPFEGVISEVTSACVTIGPVL